MIGATDGTPMMERDAFLAVWSNSPANAARFFGYSLKMVRVEVKDRSDDKGRVLYHVYPTKGAS